MADKLRADLALVRLGLAPSREKAQAMIMAGQVYLKEQKILKASEKVEEGAELTVRGHSHPFVGRGALKLDKALRVFGADVTDTVCMDIGAATGGFTDVLLQNGAKHVYAIDVGYGQLDWKIRNDERVTVMERTNARYLTHEEIPCVPDVTVMDVSFISVKLILPTAAELMDRKGRFYILIKPQFEAGREHVGKKGVVRDPAVHRQVVESIAQFVPEIGYRMAQLDFSPITGPEGNIEYITELLPACDGAESVSAQTIAQVVEAAHQTLAK
jgi:23S rRNA (cytidine1920-2'-O)/16S rRNA (cytidine1409-2'-O)-methyltransferase